MGTRGTAYIDASWAIPRAWQTDAEPPNSLGAEWFRENKRTKGTSALGAAGDHDLRTRMPLGLGAQGF